MNSGIREFLGTKSEYQTLQKALVHLYEVEEIKSQTLLTRLYSFRTNQAFQGFYTKEILPNYGAIDRLRGARRTRLTEGPNRARDEGFVNLLWAYLQVHYPELVRPSSTEEERVHPFYHHMLRFYDANEDKSVSRLATAAGRYAVYHFSERFRPPHNPPQGVVIGELFIKATKGGKPFLAEEHERYDGTRFNPHEPDTEDNHGYCIYKHDSIVVVLSEDMRHTPKWYLFDSPRISKTLGPFSMTGHMCQLVPGRNLFTSPVVARRIDDNFSSDNFNIFYCREIHPDVMDRLLVNPLPEFYDRRRTE